jgi:hypothetical protein
MIGYSSEIKYQGLDLLVQTQDKGLAAQYVETLVYLSGKIVYSQKAPYAQYLNQPGFKEKVARLLKDLHQAVLDDIGGGKLDHQIVKPKV